MGGDKWDITIPLYPELERNWPRALSHRVFRLISVVVDERHTMFITFCGHAALTWVTLPAHKGGGIHFAIEDQAFFTCSLTFVNALRAKGIKSPVSWSMNVQLHICITLHTPSSIPSTRL